MGRTTVLTPDRRQRVIELMSDGTSRNQTARLIGCAPSTITYGALRDPTFGREVAKARARHFKRLSMQMLAAAASTHTPRRQAATAPSAPDGRGSRSVIVRGVPSAGSCRPAPDGSGVPNFTTRGIPSVGSCRPTVDERAQSLADEIAADFERIAGKPLDRERLRQAMAALPNDSSCYPR